MPDNDLPQRHEVVRIRFSLRNSAVKLLFVNQTGRSVLYIHDKPSQYDAYSKEGLARACHHKSENLRFLGRHLAICT